jgi:alkanesulfonate monooxygenase SsuD/methylene tetrahydromethanopterin reductase-like flavin-dependent oxidoreductase (luciferase family)
VVDPALRLGFELPAGGTGPGRWRAAAVAAEESGAGAVWLSPGVVDPCVVAGSLVPATVSILLGVESGLGATDRIPSMLARDVTALDVLSGGRTAVLLAGDDLGLLAEAVTVCRLMFTGDAPSYRGRHFALDGAANRPPPFRPGGPPILVAPPQGAPPVEVGTALAEADAVVVGGGPAEVAAWRSAVAGQGLLRRGSLGGAAEGAALLGAGADGLIVRLADDGEAWPTAVEALAAAFGAGRRRGG